MLKRPEREGVMLCYPTEEGRVQRLGPSFIAQPKLNGERARVEWFHGEPVILSSYNNEFKYLSNIKETLIENFGKLEAPFDGEIYKHGWPRERIDSALRRKTNYNPDVEKLEFHIFDVQDARTSQIIRLATLEAADQKGLFAGPLKFVPYEITGPRGWTKVAEKYYGEGYEGVVLRHPNAVYIPKRTVTMLKFKPTEEDEYEIIGVQEGTGWCEGKLGAFIVRGDDGTEFNVGSGRILTKEGRTELWQNREDLVGMTLVVKHEKMKTSGGVPIAAVAFKLKTE